MAGRINDVDVIIPPFTVRRSRSDRDAPLLFLLHPVHDRRAFMHFAQLVGAAGVIKDALGRSGLAGINVRHDADIAHPLDGNRTGHRSDHHR